ncbi:hypothetical protein [Proteiniphilum sp. UBA5375]|uniref:hypothetical protein n=1 Tax=Proteiniphilum sp. UBA5375 TaxID=1947278 RepID=UPI00257E861F|nr:hypothetical protein [Proteiniphilum sp. UBA5375]
MIDEEIKCPECGGNLVFWKEYILSRTQAISKTGVLSDRVKKSKPVEFNCNDIKGFECKKCGWVFNTANDIEKCEKYPHLIRWEESHADELKV